MTAPRPYSRIYHEIADHPRFSGVYANDAALGAWLRMLLIADALWPTSAPMPRKNPTVRLLIECGLVIEKPGDRYTIRGLDAERERRSSIGRNAADKRWQSERNANAMPRRDETSKDKTSNGANAPAPGVFMGMRPKSTPSPDDVKRQHDEAWTKCAECGVVGRKHPASGEHQFRPELRSVS